MCADSRSLHRYPKTEIVNLGRFISVMKFRPLLWQNTHPYIVADRIEDVTDPEEKRQHPEADRRVCMFGCDSNCPMAIELHLNIFNCVLVA